MSGILHKTGAVEYVTTVGGDAVLSGFDAFHTDRTITKRSGHNWFGRKLNRGIGSGHKRSGSSGVHFDRFTLEWLT